MRLRRELSGRPDGDFYCSYCYRRCSVRPDTLLQSLHLSPQKFTQIIIHWLLNDSHVKIASEVGTSLRTVSRYSERLLVASVLLLQKNSRRIGGEGRIVEIDECLLGRRKYQRGRLKIQHWVLGGIERPLHEDETPGLFLVSCADRTQETLEHLIQKWVKPGTLIITDCLKSYSHLDQLGYSHYSVNHSQNFIDPATGCHTQRIEGVWHWVRKEAFSGHGDGGATDTVDIDFRLAAFLYRRFVRNDIEKFVNDLGSISHSDVCKLLADRRLIKQQLEPPDDSELENQSENESLTSQRSHQQQLLDESLISSPRLK